MFKLWEKKARKILSINEKIGYAKEDLLCWLMNNREELPGSYRKIESVSGRGFSTIHSTMSTLVEEGMVKKEGGKYIINEKCGQK